MMKKLCIAIPTYNRGGLIEAQLKRLLPQIESGVHLHVFDNASTDDTVSRINSFAHPDLLVTSSAFNGGMARNICKALEEADAEWVWVLGDDDPVIEGSLSRALKMCAEAGSGVIEFDSMGGEVREDRCIKTLADLYKLHDPIRTLFISSHLFHKTSVSPYFSILAPGCFTFGPHTALIIRMLENASAPLWLRKESLIKPVHTVKGWSTLEVALGMSLLPEFIKSQSFQKLASHRLLMDTAWMHCFGLREITDRETAKRWKRLTKQSLGNLRAYGSGRLPLGDRSRRPTIGEIKDYCITRAALFLPTQALKKIGAILRKKYSHDRQAELKDF